MKNLIMIVLCFALANKAMAQTTEAKKPNLYLNVAVLSCGAKQEAITDANEKFDLGSIRKLGYAIGLSSFISLGKKMVFNPEINYVRKDVSYNLTAETFMLNVQVKSSTTIHYVEIPLNFVYSFAQQKQGFFVGIGPVISLPFSGKQTISVNDSQFASNNIHFNGKEPTDSTVNLSTFDLAANAFVGYKFSNTLQLKLVYNQSFKNMNYPTYGTFINNYVGLALHCNLIKQPSKK